MKEIRVAIVGDIAWNEDITPFGKKVSPGGAAYYSSVGASRFSEGVGTVARVGKDFDLSYLTEKGIDVEGVTVSDKERTCRFVLRQHADNSREFTAERGVAGIVDASIFPDSYLTARYIHLPTQLPAHALTWIDKLDHRYISVDSFEAFVQEFPEMTKEMFRKASLIFTNESEFQTLKQLGEETFNAPIILKKGKDGAAYIYKNDTIVVPASPVDPIDTTGAGDVLAGAFLAQRANGVGVEESLKNAVELASKSVTQFGVEHIGQFKNGRECYE
jgi:ribokinase